MEVSNKRLEKMKTMGLTSTTSAEVKSIAAELLMHRRRCGDAPEKCEGCDAEATKTDSEGVHFCERCWENL